MDSLGDEDLPKREEDSEGGEEELGEPNTDSERDDMIVGSKFVEGEKLVVQFLYSYLTNLKTHISARSHIRG